MLNHFDRIQILNDFFPFIKSLIGSTIVIKYGGSAMKDDILKNKFIDNIVFLSSVGVKIILVHGGGPMINNWLNRVDIKPKFKDGIRVTDIETMEIVEMVLSGKVNRELVALINKKKSCAVGLSGKDANLFIASKLNNLNNDYVGQVKVINLRLINILLSQGYIPVITSVACNDKGQTYNINADNVAGCIASSLQVNKLIYLTDTPGIMLDINDENTLISKLNLKDVKDLKQEGIIFGGMIPKVNCCINALQNHVQSVHIIDGRSQNSLLISLLTDERIGSVLVA